MDQIYKLHLKREAMPETPGLMEFLGIKLLASDHFAKLVKEFTDDEPTEHSFAFYLTNSNDLIGLQECAIGGMNSVSADPKVIISSALLCGASRMVLVHNHPSGNHRPSKNDIRSAKRLARGAHLCGITLWDEIIVSNKGWS